MALSGTQVDLYVRKYTDMYEHELQQNGSLLRGLVSLEKGAGDRVAFRKIGAMGSYVRTARYEPKQNMAQTFEVRYAVPKMVEFSTVIDEMDLDRYSVNPQSDLVQAGAMELGRQLDTIIIEAMGGSALRELGGSTSNATFDTSNNQIAVSTNTYTSLSGDTALHEGKLLKAKRILQGNKVDVDREPLIVVAPAKQLANLHARAIQTNLMWKKLPEINLPGLDKGLDGFLGMRFIAIESDMLGVDGSNDENVYVFVPSAIKLAMWRDVKVDIHSRHDLAGDPLEITANFDAGAVRMFEEKIVRILCDPS